jgi:hypothetical protein
VKNAYCHKPLTNLCKTQTKQAEDYAHAFLTTQVVACHLQKKHNGVKLGPFDF